MIKSPQSQHTFFKTEANPYERDFTTQFQTKYKSSKKSLMTHNSLADSMTKLQQEVNRLQEEKNNSDQNNQLIISKLQQQNDQQKNEKELLEKEFCRYKYQSESKFKVCEQELYEVSNSIKLKEIEIIRQANRNIELENQQKELKEQLKQSGQEYQEILQQQKDIQQKRSVTLNNQSIEISKYQQLSQAYKEEKETIQNEYDEYQKVKAKEIKELNNKIQYLFEQLNQLRENHNDEIQQFSTELKNIIDDNKQQVNSLHMNLKITQTQLDDKQSLIASRDNYIQELNDKIQYLQSQIDHQKRLLADDSSVFSGSDKSFDDIKPIKQKTDNQILIRTQKPVIQMDPQNKYQSEKFFDPYNNELFDIQKNINEMNNLYEKLDQQFKRQNDTRQKSEIRREMVELAININRQNEKLIQTKNKYDNLFN